MFNNFIEYNILPYYESFEADNALLVIIYNNTSIHYNISLTRIYSNAGVLLEYLPPYSLDLNPIETLFVISKSWIRRNFKLA